MMSWTKMWRPKIQPESKVSWLSEFWSVCAAVRHINLHDETMLAMPARLKLDETGEFSETVWLKLRV